jgi:ABC-type branched-subunit amino acid transport system substrate-binding protein
MDTEEFQKHPASEKFKCSSPDDFQELVQGIREKNSKAVVLYCEPERSLELIRFLRSQGVLIPVYSGLNILHERNFSSLVSDRVVDLYFLGSGTWMTDLDSDFVQEFHREFGHYPGAMAAYAFDAIQILVEAIKKSDSDPEKVKQNLSKTSYVGKTGSIEFDRLGNRKSTSTPGVVSAKRLYASKP